MGAWESRRAVSYLLMFEISNPLYGLIEAVPGNNHGIFQNFQIEFGALRISL